MKPKKIDEKKAALEMILIMASTANELSQMGCDYSLVNWEELLNRIEEIAAEGLGEK